MQIAIVGGGATGVLAALHLARRLSVGMAEILVIEPTTRLGRGLAYSTSDPRHLLNVRVANMSAFADRPYHLLEWLQRSGRRAGAAALTSRCFIPRGVYGEYIADLARELIAAGAIRHIVAHCTDLVETKPSVVIKLDSGAAHEFDRVILATGHDTKSTLSGIPALQPWTPGALSELKASAPILIMGTGLTMVDTVLSLDRQGHRGKVTALSHHGLLSAAHRPVKTFAVAANEVPFGAEISQLLRWLRRLSRRLTDEGGDWRSAVDALRPHTQSLWRAMSAQQKQRFCQDTLGYSPSSHGAGG
jgi:uncharacterized NAD(P)/FAD-binding protein YdhS